MATLTRKPATLPAGSKRPALRATAGQGTSVPPAVPSTSSDIRDEAAYAIGYQAGLIEGQKIGAERERAALTTDESIEDRMKRIVSRTLYPVTGQAVDRVTACVFYAFGATVTVGFVVLIWRILKWI